MEYWIEDGLSYLASAVGVPLYADSATESHRRINYARVCVELDATKPLIDEFLIDVPDAHDPNIVCDEITIKVSYRRDLQQSAFRGLTEEILHRIL